MATKSSEIVITLLCTVSHKQCLKRCIDLNMEKRISFYQEYCKYKQMQIGMLIRKLAADYDSMHSHIANLQLYWGKKMMRNQISIRYYRFAIAIMTLIMVNGCTTTAGYQKPISDFQNGSSVVTESARIYVTQLNKTQRDAYIDRQVRAADQIKLSEVEKVQMFSPEAIETRLGALNELSKYGELLVQLANSDVPEKISSNAGDLAKSLESLNGNINKLDPTRNTNFKGTFGPAALLMGEVARLAVEKKIQEALDKAILSGEEPIKKLIRTIRNDLVTAYELKRNAMSDSRTIYVDGYERERLKRVEVGSVLKELDVVNLKKRSD